MLRVPALLRHCLCVAVVPTLLAETAAPPHAVDYRYAPATWHAALGWPDDWHKPLVSDTGALLYDFGPGPYAQPLTTIGVSVRDATLMRERQWLDEPGVPIVRTSLAGGGRVEVTTFSLPPTAPAPSNGRFERYERLDGIMGALGWANPAVPCAPEFRNVAWGINRPIRYRVRVEPGARRQIALGFCESYKPRLNERVAEMTVEGAPVQTADLALTAPRHAPQVFLFAAHDVDADGWINIVVAAPAGRDPNTTLAMIAVYPADARPTRDALIAGGTASGDTAELRIACGTEFLRQPARVDVLQATFTGTGAPQLRVRTGRTLERADDGLTLGGRPFVATQPRPERIDHIDGHWVLEFPAGTAEVTTFVFSGEAGAATRESVRNLQLSATLADAQRRWRAAGLPPATLTVGDAALQGLLAASMRTIYQARESINGRGQFNSSFTLYRGLWAGDAVYTVELAAMLGDFASARETLETLFSFQNARGLIDEMPPLVLFRTTPAVFWALQRYAALSGDNGLARAKWDGVMRGVRTLRDLRAQTLAEPGAVNAGLLPAGFNDGGIMEIGAEYSSVYWTLTGLEAAASLAQTLGRTADAAEIDALHAEFLRSFDEHRRRDERTDAQGNRFLPVRVGHRGPVEIPQLAQWAVLESHLFGRALPLDGELLRGTLGMLRASERQGLPHSTGWLRDGIWAGYGALYAHLPLLRGEADHTSDLLYAVANHASPLGTWVEEQSPLGSPPKTAGDQPHTWASALFVRLCLSMLACEHRGTVHFLSAVPAEWLRAGAVNRLTGFHTAAGEVNLNLSVDATGRRATLAVEPIGRTGEKTNIVLHTRSLRAAGFSPTGVGSTVDDVPLKAGERFTAEFVRR